MSDSGTELFISEVAKLISGSKYPSLKLTTTLRELLDDPSSLFYKAVKTEIDLIVSVWKPK